MADQLNVDLVNIRDVTLFPNETDLSLLEFYSRKGSVNRKIDALDLATEVALVNNLGTFTGSTIPDNVSTYDALQSLETALEAIVSGEANTASNLGGGTGIFESKSGVDLRFKSLVAGSNVAISQNATTITIAASGGGGGGTALAYDNFTSGNFTANVTRFGALPPVFNSPAAGEFNFTFPSNVDFSRMSIFGNNTTLNASQEMIIRLDNSANSRNRRIMLQLFDANNGAVVDQQLTATVHVVTVAGNITTITVPGLNGFGAAGFYIEIA